MFRPHNKFCGKIAALLKSLRCRRAPMVTVSTVANVGVRHGVWGEEVAAEFLSRKGYSILARNARPCKWDHRLEIDIVAQDPTAKTLVFVEVKQHKRHSPYERRLRSVNAHKKDLLKVACNTWRKMNHWNGNYQFDVIEVFGVPGQKDVEVDHIQQVNLFTPDKRFINWDN
jgi:putative endonuclease